MSLRVNSHYSDSSNHRLHRKNKVGMVVIMDYTERIKWVDAGLSLLSYNIYIYISWYNITSIAIALYSVQCKAQQKLNLI